MSVDDVLRGGSTSHAVLNISELGMLVDSLKLPQGHRLSFELEGGGLSASGRGHIAHCTDAGAGISVDHWDSSPDELRTMGIPDVPAAAANEDYVSDWA